MLINRRVQSTMALLNKTPQQLLQMPLIEFVQVLSPALCQTVNQLAEQTAVRRRYWSIWQEVCFAQDIKIFLDPASHGLKEFPADSPIRQLQAISVIDFIKTQNDLFQKLDNQNLRIKLPNSKLRSSFQKPILRVIEEIEYFLAWVGLGIGMSDALIAQWQEQLNVNTNRTFDLLIAYSLIHSIELPEQFMRWQRIITVWQAMEPIRQEYLPRIETQLLAPRELVLLAMQVRNSRIPKRKSHGRRFAPAERLVLALSSIFNDQRESSIETDILSPSESADCPDLSPFTWQILKLNGVESAADLLTYNMDQIFQFKGMTGTHFVQITRFIDHLNADCQFHPVQELAVSCSGIFH